MLIKSPLFIAPSALALGSPGAVMATCAAGVTSTFNIGPDPEGRPATEATLNVEAYPAPAEARETGLAQLLLLTIAEPRFSFLSFEYRLPLALLAGARRITLRLFAAADIDVICRLGVGGFMKERDFEFFTMQPTPVGETFANSVQSIEVDLLPTAALEGEHLSTCLLFERRVATVAFALTVEIA